MAGEMTTKQYLIKFLDNKEEFFNEITRLNQEEKERYNLLLDNLILVNNNKKVKQEVKGKSLEDIVSFLLEKSNVFKVQRNLRTSTNEIDQIIELNFRGKEFKEHIDILGDTFLGECKNYNKKIGVTWVGKFYSLLQPTCRLGVIFSFYGLSGKGWNASSGLVKKLHISKEDFSHRIYIIDFNILDFRLVAQGKSFINIIQAKISGLRTDTDFLKHISDHPAQQNKSNHESD
ncbi:restriction endonuclease [Desulfosporosinus sp. PR]|uniref:restriction endonuclease n=1 Tax=Candidatus Desulfosporosinus nitrosoreducens TaxID=3401928 RepID=UPI0027F01453|nr:restriction endonuclease [Desulfosporosinus sp. PR]MDQ7094241.1 restriction endonuclease [Desulfosporosinus sp. PR]